MPTSVLLAVLAAAGLLALAPALVRRYDATERLVAERALSTARVLTRAGTTHSQRRKRTVPGRRPINPPRAMVPPLRRAVPSTVADEPHVSAAIDERRAAAAAVARRRRSRTSRAVYRRRRVLLALVVLNLVELVGVLFASPGFAIGSIVSGGLLLAYLVHLRNRALIDRRRRRAEARYAAWVAERQAAVRREQARRAALRREAIQQHLAERDRARREAARLSAVRGRQYDSRAVGQ